MNFLKKFFKHPKAVIAGCIIVTAGIGFFITKLDMDNSLRQFFPQKDVAYERLINTEDTFGSMLAIGVTFEAKNGTILTPEYIDVIRKITDQVLELENVENVDSLTHIDYVCADSEGAISASQLIPEEYTGSDEDIEQLKNRLNEWHDMYNRVIVNDDNTGAQMQISLVTKTDLQIERDKAKEAYDLAAAEAKANPGEESKAAAEEAKKALKEAEKALKAAPSDSARQQLVLDQIREIALRESEGHDLKVILVGEPVLSENSRNFMMSDLFSLIPLVAVVVLLSLYMSFKTIDGTLLPLITVLMSTAISCGLMGIFGITFTLVSSVIPVALIAVGSAYGIHILTHYYIAVSEIEGEITKEKYENAVFEGIKDVWIAVLLAGITTVVGFISLVTSPIGPLHSFSIFTAVGVTLSLLLSVTFIPAFLLCKDYKKIGKKSETYEKISKKAERIKEKLERLRKLRGNKSADEAQGDTLYGIFKFFCGSAPRLVITSICIVVLSFTGLRLLKIDTALINYFPKNAQFRKDIDYVDQQFAGTNSVYFNITGENKGDITNPELLKAVDNMEQYLAKRHHGIGKIVSFTTFVKRINQVWFDPNAPVQESGASSESFGDDMSFGDDFGFGDEFGFGDDFGFDEPASETAAAASDWVDPNIKYREMLEGKLTTKEIIEMINSAYVNAGGKYATVDAIVDKLMEEVNFKGKAYYEIPYNPEKYPQPTREELKSVVDGYLILLSGSLGRFIDDDMNPQIMRITCQLRNHSTIESKEIIDDAKKYAETHFPEGFVLEATGSGEMEVSMTSMIVNSQFSSLIVSLLSVFIIITISFRSGWAGLVGAVPLAFAILLNYMVMGFAHINLDLVTSIIASVAVGVGIDYTIHFLTTYRAERAKSDDIIEVTKNTFRKSGHGIATNALAVGLGFLVLCLSKFVVLRYIGILVAIVMFTSSLLAMTIIPGILTLFDPKFIKPKKSEEK